MADYTSEFQEKIDACRDGAGAEKTPFAKKIQGQYFCSISAGSRVCKYQGFSDEGTVCRKLTPYRLEESLAEPAPAGDN
jgi:hypothetical protein